MKVYFENANVNHEMGGGGKLNERSRSYFYCDV